MGQHSVIGFSLKGYNFYTPEESTSLARGGSPEIGSNQCISAPEGPALTLRILTTAPSGAKDFDGPFFLGASTPS